MKETKKVSKNKWTQIFKKKWFFPALYIMLAAFLLTGVIWYQNAQSNLIEGIDDVEESESYIDKKHLEYWDECIDPDYKPVDLVLEQSLIAPSVMKIIKNDK